MRRRRPPTSRVEGAVFMAAVLMASLATAPAQASVARGEHPLYSPEELAAIYRHSPAASQPVDPDSRVADDPRAARLGQFLFFDTRFSPNGKVSCATCHQPQLAFTDARRFGRGLAVGNRNTPTVLNAAYNHWFFWDGRADSLWSQALQPMENPKEIGSDRLHVSHLIYGDPALRNAYEQVFGPMPSLSEPDRFPAHARPDSDAGAPAAKAWTGMNENDRTTIDRIFSNVGKAVEAYERKLVGRNSPFDVYVSGLRAGDPAKLAALSPAALRGLKLFVGAAGCELCHSGPNFTDGEFHNLGLPIAADGTMDAGRAAGITEVKADTFNALGPFSDQPSADAKDRLAFLPPAQSKLGSFKTPTLRNVALTAPYMHDGRFASLREVLAIYAKGKPRVAGQTLGQREATLDLIPHLKPGQISDLIAFLGALNDEPPPQALTRAPPHP